VSEYTMSEIIASVYDVMAQSGIREGILFLDEINCVSETLAPSMLQFLQYKIFGRHQVPEGWVIVTAGNPPEYNKSVREFDVVTMDRLKILEVEADYAAWREYAKERGVHTAILNYLDMKKEDFYQVETTVKGKSYITARGWEDLSEMLKLYEEEQITAEESFVGQYLRNDRVVKEFTAYYDLYRKYQNDYKAEEILTGTVSEQAKDKARKADFDERRAQQKNRPLSDNGNPILPLLILFQINPDRILDIILRILNIHISVRSCHSSQIRRMPSFRHSPV